MTLNSKVLSLVLLSGLTMGGTFAKKQKLNSTDWTNESQTVKWSEDKCDSKQCHDCEAIAPENCPCPPLKDCTVPLTFRGNGAPDNVVFGTGQPANGANQSLTLTRANLELSYSCALNEVTARIVICGSDVKSATRVIVAKPTAPDQDVLAGPRVFDFDLTKYTPSIDTTGTIATYCIHLTQALNLREAGPITAPASIRNMLSAGYLALAEGTGQFAVYDSANVPQLQGNVLVCCCDDEKDFCGN